MEQVLADSIASRRFSMSLLALFAGIALALAAIGVYGVISYAVTQKKREFGIRMALGARRGEVLWLIVGQGMTRVLAGIGAGLAGALVLTRLMAGLLFGVKPTDPVTLLAAIVLLTIVALLACYIPARRATKADPAITLRCE
jgi:putative ABC transport system permease protein